MSEIQQLQERVKLLENLLFALIKSDKYYFGKAITFADGLNISVSTGTGTRFGTATGQKLGFFNATPVVQRSAISAPSGGATVDAESRTAINSLRQALIDLGLTA